MATPVAGPSRKRQRDDSASRNIASLPRRSNRRTQKSGNNELSPVTGDNRQPQDLTDSDDSDDSDSSSSQSNSSDDEAGYEEFDHGANGEESDTDEDDEEPVLTQSKGKRCTTGQAKKSMCQTKNPRSKPNPPAVRDPQLLQKLTTDSALITIDNYRVMSVNWTDRYIDQLLAHRKDIVNTRPPGDVYADAEIHQAHYRRNKKLLSLVGHCSPMSMDAAL